MEILKHIASPVLLPETMDLQQLGKAVSAPGLTTVLPKDFFEALLKHLPHWQNVIGKNNWVQAGVWKGGGALFLKAVMEDLNNSGKLFLFDTFSNIPTTNLTREKDQAFIKHFNISNNITGYKQAVVELFEQQDLYQNVHLIEGDIAKTAGATETGQISLLHIDVDFYEPVLATLQHFYKRMVPGGLVIVDDYFLDYVNCKDAVDDFLRTENQEIKITRLSSYAAYFRKQE